jgi:hypothetical protein
MKRKRNRKGKTNKSPREPRQRRKPPKDLLCKICEEPIETEIFNLHPGFCALHLAKWKRFMAD